MAIIEIKVPRDSSADYDYIAFSFQGLHSYEDFGVYRISDNNSGYNDSLTPPLTDKTAEHPARDGQFFFGSQHKSKIINIKIAFDNLSESKLKQFKRWLDSDNTGPLWFAEAPHRVYWAKITGTATTTSIAFTDENGDRIYKGTGSIQFTCYDAYARTPNIVITPSGKRLSGNSHTSYMHFPNYEEIKKSLPLMTKDGTAEPEESAFGDMPFHFKAKLLSPFDEEDVTIISDIVGESYYIENAVYSEEDGVYIIN